MVVVRSGNSSLLPACSNYKRQGHQGPRVCSWLQKNISDEVSKFGSFPLHCFFFPKGLDEFSSRSTCPFTLSAYQPSVSPIPFISATTIRSCFELCIPICKVPFCASSHLIFSTSKDIISILQIKTWSSGAITCQSHKNRTHNFPSDIPSSNLLHTNNWIYQLLNDLCQKPGWCFWHCLFPSLYLTNCQILLSLSPKYSSPSPPLGLPSRSHIFSWNW